MGRMDDLSEGGDEERNFIGEDDFILPEDEPVDDLTEDEIKDREI